MLITDKKILSDYGTDRRIWQGIPGIVCTKKGNVFVSLYSGMDGETFGNYALVLKGNEKGEFNDIPVAVADKGKKARCFDPVVWIDPINRLWFVWSVQPENEVWGAICDDPDADEVVFGEEFCIGYGVMMNKPTVLTTGEWLFPIAQWLPNMHACYRSAETMGTPLSYVYKTSDNGKTFIKLGGADVRDRSFDEHMVLELKNGVLQMFVRTRYGIGTSYSYDRGITWSKGEKTPLGGPCSRFFIGRLRSGRVLLINHVNFTGRNNLTALLSEDDGKTFPYSILLDGRSSIAYPDAMETEDGSIHIVYDHGRGGGKKSLDEVYKCAREILMAKITEEDIINGSLVSEGSYLAKTVNKLGLISDKVNVRELFGYGASDKALAEELISGEKSDIVGNIFRKFPFDCVERENFDIKQFDKMIAQFEETGSNDVSLLEKIIEFARNATEKPEANQPIIERAKAYVEEHISEDFAVSAVAKALNVSVYYLSHLFKEITGTTVTEYRNEFKLTRAKQLLIGSDKPIGDIAQECGFCDSAYFTKIFSRSERVAPTDYRKMHRKA